MVTSSVKQSAERLDFKDQVQPTQRGTSFNDHQDPILVSQVAVVVSDSLLQRESQEQREQEARLVQKKQQQQLEELRAILRKRTYVAALLGLALLIVAGVSGGLVCGMGSCRRNTEDDISSIPGRSPFVSMDPSFPEATARRDIFANNTAAWISGISYRQGLSYPPQPVFGSDQASPEELALQWLIEENESYPYPSSFNTRFRHEQRYSLATLWFQSNKTWAPTGEGSESFDSGTDWATSAHECDWRGVGCTEIQTSTTDRRVVTRIQLAGWGIEGTLPPDLALLTDVQEFSLWDNPLLAGPIPRELAVMTKLTRLGISSTSLTGSIPTEIVSSLADLQVLVLKSNELTGTLPQDWSSLTALTQLQLTRNWFSGDIPSSLGSLENLRYLTLGENLFTGVLPDSLANHSATGFSDESLEIATFVQRTPSDIP